MPKQKKNLNSSFHIKSKKKKKYTISRKKRLYLERSRSLGKTSLHPKNVKFYLLSKPQYRLGYIATLKITQNNLFCSCRSLNSTRFFCHSAGEYKIRISKRKMKYNHKLIIPKFVAELKQFVNNRAEIPTVLFKLIGPRKIRRSILKLLRPFFKNKQIILSVIRQKCFNGCRPSKKRRKKRNYFRIRK